MECNEMFNPDYLNYIVENFEVFKPQLRWRDRYDEIDPFKIIKKYLHRSRNGLVKVNYKQNDCKGRFCAVGSMSLQVIPREIRQTICGSYYVDIDMCNAHPIILQWLCKKAGYECSELTNYINNRDELLKKVKFDGEYSRDNAKQVYLALTNGGVKDYNLVDSIIKETDIQDIKTSDNNDLTKYKIEMIRLHRLFSQENPTEFNKTKERRQKQNKDYNHEASYMNTLLCDMENTILQEMYNFFGEPDNCVLCFDGIMLRNDKEYDLENCENYIIKKFEMPLFKLSQKSMSDGIDMSIYKIPKYEYFKLEYYADFRNLIKEDEIYEEWLVEWVNNSLHLIENNGKPYFITRNKKIVILSDKTKDIMDEWNPIKLEDINRSLSVKIKTKNIYYDYTFSQKYKEMKKKDKDGLKISPEDIFKLTNYNTYTTLGNTHPSLGLGYLSYLMENREIESYNSTDFYPYLQRNGAPPLEDTFNLFTKFPFDTPPSPKLFYNFEDSRFYKHLKEDFFNNDKGELEHFLDHIADIIQDPARIKGTSHLFYSNQGCGKGLLNNFMSKLLGISNVITFTNTDAYFEKSFNNDVCNKLLKIFEEVSEKGGAFKNHNRLKGEQTSDSERIEPKGIDAYSNRHCARFWYHTNNENTLYIENDCRRHTLHRISNRHQNNFDYFNPMWEDNKDVDFIKSAFEYFATRKYELKNVMNAYTTQYKKEQKDANLSNGVKFIINFIKKDLPEIIDKNIKIPSDTLKSKYKSYCEDLGIKYHITTLNTQIKKIGILPPKQTRITDTITGEQTKKFCYIINTHKLQEDMKTFLQDTEYLLNDKDDIDNCSLDDLYVDKTLFKNRLYEEE
jgi:hypothetical protein